MSSSVSLPLPFLQSASSWLTHIPRLPNSISACKHHLSHRSHLDAFLIAMFTRGMLSSWVLATS